MELWLRRLAGKFRIDGTYENSGGTSKVGGIAECVSIGTGAGVHCVISAKWIAPEESHKNPGSDDVLYKAMKRLVIVYGIDPDALAIRAPGWLTMFSICLVT